MAGMDVFKSTPAKIAYGVGVGGLLTYGGIELVKASQAPAQAMEQQKQAMTQAVEQQQLIQNNVDATLQALTPTATPTNTEVPPSPTLPAATPTSMLGDWLGGGTPTPQQPTESPTPTNTVVAPAESPTPSATVRAPITGSPTPGGAIETPTQTATPAAETRFVIDNATEASWPDMTDEAVKKWGGEADQWSRDLYQGQDGKLHWDGYTWRFEGFPLKNGVVANGDGTYNDASGKLIVNLGEIYDFSATPDFTDITLNDADPSDYASGYRGSKAPHDAGTLTYGYGNATLEDVEQAVIRKVPTEVCPPDQGGAGKWGAHKDAEQAFQTDPRIINGENSILMWDEATGTFYKMDKLVIYDAALPASYPETAKGAAEQFGGNPEQWRKDIYMRDGKAHWDGTWVFEGFPNKVPARVDGVYLKADGSPMSEQEIYDLTPEKAQFTDIHVNDGEFATGYRGKLAPKNPGSLDVAYDESTLEGVEQAVIRVPNENGICVPNPEATAKIRATDMLNNDIIAHANTPGGFNWNENVLRMWNDIKKQFEIVTKP